MATPKTPVVNAGSKYINGLGISRTSSTSLTVDAGQCRDSTNTNDIISTGSLVLSSLGTGANGLDTGTIAASTLYSLHLIGSSDSAEPTALLLSLSATDPYLPFNYDEFFRIAFISTDQNSFFREFYKVSGNGNRWMLYDGTLLQVLNAGAATSYTDVSLSTTVPAMVTQVLLQATYTPGTAGHTADLRGDDASGTFVQLTGPVASQAMQANLIVPCNASASIQYKNNSSGTLSLSAGGYLDVLI